jgi:hypothetical protein
VSQSELLVSRCYRFTIFAKMSVHEKQTIHDSKSGDLSPVPQSDIEVGSVGVVEDTKDGDEALRFLKNQHDVGPMTEEDERKLVRKIDWMIMPLMWACYCLQYLDKTLGTPTIVTTHRKCTDSL